MKFREFLHSLTFGSQTDALFANSAAPFGPRRVLRGSRAAGGRLDCLHLHKVKKVSVGYLFNQRESTLGVSLNCIVVPCRPGSRQQVQTVVQ